jgi:PAS domain S-box-containing protein
MTYESSTFQIPEPYYTPLFEALSASSYLIKSDAPRYTIVAVTPQILTLTGLAKADLVGRGIFEAFPSNPADPADTGEANLRTSFHHVLQYKVPHQLPIQRYDVAGGDGSFEERYWRAENRPVFGPDGEIAYIIHSTEDITDQVKRDEREEKHNELQRAYQQLEESEQKYRCLFESIDQGFCVVEVLYDTDGAPSDHLILEINPMFEKQTGIKDAEGKKASEVIPGMEKLWTEMYHKVAVSGKAIRFVEESPAQGKWYDAYCFKIGDKESRKVALLFADITEQKKADAMLRESEQFARILFQTSPAAMLIYTGDEMLLQDANQKMLELLGNDSSIIGKSIFETMPTLKKSSIQSQYNEVRATGQAHKEYAGRVELLKRGQSYWGYFDYTYEPLRNADGDVYGVICTAMDVTEQVLARQALEDSEAALRNAVMLAELGTWTMDVETGVMIFSKRQAELWGFDSLETTAEEAISRIIEEDRERVTKAFYGALQPGSGGRYEAEYEVANPKTKEQIIIRALGQVFYDTEGKAVAIAGTTQDITVQRQTQAALEAQVQQRTAELAETVNALNLTNKELKRSNQSLEEFAYAASHDMKEPIRKIHFFTERIKSRLINALGEEDLRFFGRVEAATQRMSTLIDDLLTYSHISKEVNFQEAVDLNHTLQLVLEDMELIIEDKKAAIVVDLLPTIQGHRRQLQQLFENLIGNALKYGKPDVPPAITVISKLVTGKEMGLRLSSDEMDKPFHLIAIRDDGIGFAQGDAERIFNVFTRLHGMAEYKGTGIGLSIARKVVENHCGYIWAESNAGEGSTFFVLLPMNEINFHKQKT